MATNSYRMTVRETNERLKGILASPDSSLNWYDVEAELDCRVAEDQKKEATQTSASKASGVTP